jgi:hypothetical protein
MSSAPTLAELTAAHENAKARVKATTGAERIAAMAERIAAWDALVAATPKLKPRGGFACRAGQRQAAQRRAEQAERNARRGR